MTAEFRLDFLCKGDVIVECKSVSVLSPTHRAQLFNYIEVTRNAMWNNSNFFPKFAVIERYFYDAELHGIINSDGKQFIE